MTRELTGLLAQRATLSADAERFEREGTGLLATMRREDLAGVDERIRACHGHHIDVAFRGILAAKESLAIEYPLEHRAIGATARGQVGGNDTSFGTAFWNAAVAAAPILAFCTLVNTEDGAPFTLGYIAANPSSNGIVTDGSTINDTDPTFGGRPLVAYPFKQLLRISAEMVADSAFDAEGYAGGVLGPLSIRDFADDLISGDGSSKPLGLTASGITNVNAAAAGAITLDDVAGACEAVPAAHMFSGRGAILISPGAYWDLRRQTLGTSAAGGMAVDPTLPYVGGTLLGFPFAVETGLAAPATGAVSVVAGDIAAAYGARIAPLRVESDNRGTLSTDRVLVRTIVRGDGAPLLWTAVRGVVGP
jgi:HK97 family phage major capsid protein